MRIFNLFKLFKDFIEVQGVRVFNGFPYLMTDLANGFYHIIPLPSRWSKEKLLNFAQLQVKANQLVSYLMLKKNEFFRILPVSPESIQIHKVDVPPAAELYFCGRLYPALEIPQDRELKARNERITRVVQELLDSGRYVEISIEARGGRQATDEELKSLSGYYTDKSRGFDYKIPLGLIECEKCGHWRGHCLYRNHVIPVHCECENNNRCARCGKELYRYKLNSNNYFQFLCHVSPYRALGHVCEDLNDSDEYLVSIYNRETTCSGWVWARGDFLDKLRKKFIERGIDISQIVNSSGGFTFGFCNFGVLFRKKVINMRYLVRYPDDLC